jgi:hypothetical protein
MNLEVYTFSCLLKEYDEDYAALSPEEQYQVVNKYYKDYCKSEYAKDTSDLVTGMHVYLENKYLNTDIYDSYDLEED